MSLSADQEEILRLASDSGVRIHATRDQGTAARHLLVQAAAGWVKLTVEQATALASTVDWAGWNSGYDTARDNR